LASPGAIRVSALYASQIIIWKWVLGLTTYLHSKFGFDSKKHLETIDKWFLVPLFSKSRISYKNLKVDSFLAVGLYPIFESSCARKEKIGLSILIWQEVIFGKSFFNARFLTEIIN